MSNKYDLDHKPWGYINHSGFCSGCGIPVSSDGLVHAPVNP